MFAYIRWPLEKSFRNLCFFTLLIPDKKLKITLVFATIFLVLNGFSLLRKLLNVILAHV